MSYLSSTSVNIEHILDADAGIRNASASLIRQSSIVVNLYNRLRFCYRDVKCLKIIFRSYRSSSGNPVLVLRTQSLHGGLPPFGHHRILAHLQCPDCLGSHCEAAGENGRGRVVLRIGSEFQEPLFKSHVQGADLATRLPRLLKILDGLSPSYTIWAGTGIIVVVSIDAL